MGHPFCFGCPKEDKDNSRSLRDDNKKGNRNCNGNRNGNRNCNGNSKGNSKGNRRSFDFAQDDRVRRWG